MCLRRAVTLVELIVGMVMVVVLTAAAATLYSFAAKRVAAQGAESAVQMQVNQLATEINKMASQSKYSRVAVNGPAAALVCQMPATGTDEDYDGVLDHFVPDGSSGGKEIYNTGSYIWFYMSDDTGTWGRSGTQMWRAVVASSANPGPADIDRKWSKYYGGGNKWDLIDSISFTCDPISQTTTYAISGSSLARAERSQFSDPTSPGSTFTASWTVFWQNFRNMIVNGSFEYPSVSGAGWGYFSSDGLPGGWVKTSPGPFEIQYGGFGGTPLAGNQDLELDADVPGSIKQTIPTEAGKSYALSFYYTPRPGCSSNKIEVKWNGAHLDTMDGDGMGLPQSGAWTRKTYTVTANSTTTDLEFIDQSTIGDKMGGHIDNVVMMPK